jgi:hypothetical protein
VTSRKLSVSVLTACTGLKVASGEIALTRRDFAQGSRHLAAIHHRLDGSLLPAEKLYRGQQHLRLMRGVEAARELGHVVRVSIASAGYGLLAGEDPVASYECTFQGMSAPERRAWASHLGLAESVVQLLEQPADATILLLGDDYFSACIPTGELPVHQPAIVLCGARTALRMRPAANVHPLVLRESDTRRFACGLVGLKGEVAGRLLAWLATEPVRVENLAAAGLLDDLERVPSIAAARARA